MNIKELFKLKEGLAYISSNKVRIASFKDKYYKKFFNDIINKLNNHNKRGLNESVRRNYRGNTGRQ